MAFVRSVTKSNFFCVDVGIYSKKATFAGSFTPLFYFKEKCCGNASFARRYLRSMLHRKLSCKEWFRRFLFSNSGDFDVRDKEREGTEKI